MRQQALGNEEGVLGIVAHHPSIDDETMPPRTAEQSLGALWWDSLGREAQRVPHGGAEEDTAKSIAQGKRLSCLSWWGHASSQRIRRQIP